MATATKQREGRRRNFTSSTSTRVETENLHGTEYIKVPVVAVTETVLDYRGNRHELLPSEEIQQSVPYWEGMPVTVGHPSDSLQQNISARKVEARRDYEIGRFQNAHFEDGKLKGEFWINPEKAERVENGEQVLEKFRDGQMIEVSTAYTAEVEEDSGRHNGEKFNGVQRDLRPDHIATLPNSKGNCSIEDGCGAPRLNALTTARTPEFSGTSGGEVPEDWPPGLGDFVSSKGWDAEQWGDLTDEQRQTYAQTTLLGEADAETFGEAQLFPVVDENGDLQENALVAVLGGRGAQADVSEEQLQTARGVARNLLEEEFNRDLEENMSNEAKSFLDHIKAFFNQDKGEAGEGTGDDARSRLEELMDAGMTIDGISDALSSINDQFDEDVSRAPGTISSISSGEIENPPESLVEALEEIEPPENAETNSRNNDMSEEKQNEETEETEEKENCDCPEEEQKQNEEAEETEETELASELKELRNEVSDLKEELNEQKQKQKRELVEELHANDDCPLDKEGLEKLGTEELEDLSSQYKPADFTGQAARKNREQNSHPEPPSVLTNEGEEDSE